jgi:hypothetical protein
VVPGLEDVDRRQAALGKDCLDVGLRVAGEEEAPSLERSEEDERGVVHLPAVVRRRRRDPPGVGPQHIDRDAVHLEPVARSQPRRRGAARREECRQRLVPRTGPGHPRLHDPADPVPLENQREAADVVLVGMGEDDEVDPPIPGRHARIERDDEAVGVGAAVDEHPAAGRSRDEDGIPLPDVEDDDVDAAVGSGGGRDDDDRDGKDPAECCGTKGPPGGGRRVRTRPPAMAWARRRTGPG